ncbi:HAD-IA family hydrolase [Streptomyces gilvus]|uniref:HAD-IA family hydrolase n=1 Tax=Streptomyces gilvus TaxID=2920937 RepID=UPI001F0D2E1C|nr:HAD-IA family hydrolase [Streptomyces sp. CME 23]MCH5677960.1 HAD-IA family hydrolase [Streptomyces sp. CME 23]
MNARGLLLDCDGVLADTERDGHLVAFNLAFTEFDLPFRWSAEQYGPLLRIGGGKERLRSFLAEHPEWDLGDEHQVDALIRDLHVRKSALYVDLVESVALPARPGVARLISEALDDGWQVACASTSAVASVEAVLASVVGGDQRRRMAGVFAGDVVPAKKPAPDIYLLAASSIGIDREDIVVVEDSASGAAAAAAAEMAHLVTVSHFTTEDEFPAAATVVDTLGEPGSPARVLAGADVRTPPEQIITVASLQQILDRAATGSPTRRPE